MPNYPYQEICIIFLEYRAGYWECLSWDHLIQASHPPARTFCNPLASMILTEKHYSKNATRLRIMRIRNISLVAGNEWKLTCFRAWLGWRWFSGALWGSLFLRCIFNHSRRCANLLPFFLLSLFLFDLLFFLFKLAALGMIGWALSEEASTIFCRLLPGEEPFWDESPSSAFECGVAVALSASWRGLFLLFPLFFFLCKGLACASDFAPEVELPPSGS